MSFFVGLVLGFVVGWIGHAKRDVLKAWVLARWGSQK